MTAEEYLGCYHDIWGWQDDWLRQWVKVRRYVSTASGEPWKARVPIIQGLIDENPGTGWKSQSFTVDTFWTIQMIAICRVYCGKGSPTEINDMIWLAHRYGQILNLSKKKATAQTMQAYCDAYLGQDCNGFVGNYFGLDPNTSVRTYAKSPRKSVNDIQVNDLCIWYRSWEERRKFGHIGIINSIGSRTEKPFGFQLIHWGVDPANRNRQMSVTLSKTVDDKLGDKESHTYKGALYFEAKEKKGTAIVYICPPPGTPNPKP